MIFKKLFLVSLSLTLVFRSFGQTTEVLDLRSHNDHYKEQNLFLAKPKFEIVQIVTYDGNAIDDEYELQLFLRVYELDSLAENKTFNLERDTGVIKCVFDRQSVWNWEPEKTIIEGNVSVTKRSKNRITLFFDLKVADTRNNRIYLYSGQRTFSKSSMSRPKYWNSY